MLNRIPDLHLTMERLLVKALMAAKRWLGERALSRRGKTYRLYPASMCVRYGDGTACVAGMERVKGIEPSYEAWEAAVLPLNYTRSRHGFYWHSWVQPEGGCPLRSSGANEYERTPQSATQLSCVSDLAITRSGDV